MATRYNATATRGRPFQPGNSGRPHGARNKATLAVEALLEGEAEALGRAAIDAALGGDVTALRLCLDRIAPASRDRRVIFSAPQLSSAADLPSALAHLLNQVADGELTPGEAVAIGSLLDRWRSATELVELETRISKLEGAT